MPHARPCGSIATPRRALAGPRGRHERTGSEAFGRGTGTSGRVVRQGLGYKSGQMKAVTQAGLVLLGAVLAAAQTTGPILSFTATTDNVRGAPDSIRMDVLRWSTAAERDQLLAAWNNPGDPATRGRGGRGRGAVVADDPFAISNDAPLPRGGGDSAAGAGGAGGRGDGRGGGATAAVPAPERSLAAALGQMPIVGHLWSSEVTGYSVRCALKLAAPDGGERIILITDRRLGAWNDLWKPVAVGAATNYDFSVIELRLNSKGEGEGKVSLTGKIAVDSAAKAIALENFSELPVVLRKVRRK